MVSVGAGGGGRKADAAARWSGLYELLRLPGDSKAAAAARGLAALQLPPAAWGATLLLLCCCPAALELDQRLLAAQRCCSLQGR